MDGPDHGWLFDFVIDNIEPNMQCEYNANCDFSGSPAPTPTLGGECYRDRDCFGDACGGATLPRGVAASFVAAWEFFEEPFPPLPEGPLPEGVIPVAGDSSKDVPLVM
ncbi:MAG TPA: hypothetical protein VF134_07875 [Candidatus Dormibacteraeota bacterium]